MDFLKRIINTTSYRIKIPELGIEVIDIDNDGAVALCAIRGSVVARFATKRRTIKKELERDIFNMLNSVCKNNRKIRAGGEEEDKETKHGTATFTIHGREREVQFVSEFEKDEHLKYEKNEVIKITLWDFIEFYEFINNSSAIYRFIEMISKYKEGSMLRHASMWLSEDPNLEMPPLIPGEEHQNALTKYVEAIETVQGQEFTTIANQFFENTYDKGFPAQQIVEAAQSLMDSQSGDVEEREETITVTLSLEKWNRLKELLNDEQFQLKKW